MTKLLIGMVIVTYFARFNKSGKTTLFPEVFSDSMFYSFWFYTKEVLADALNGLDEVPQEFAESISSLKKLL